MSHSTLVIPNVDATELEKQRLALGSLDQASLNQVQQEALNGICEMLDYWSDRAHRLYTIILNYPQQINLVARAPYIETLEASSMRNAVKVARKHAVQSLDNQAVDSMDFELIAAIRGTVARR